MLLREALCFWEAGVPVALGLATHGIGLLCCKGGGLIYIKKISILILPLVWMRACPEAHSFFHFIHPAVLIFRTDADCGLKCLFGEGKVSYSCWIGTCFMNSCACELMGAMGWEISDFF